MKASHSWLQSYFKKPIPTAEKLAEFFTFHAFEVEGIEEINTGAYKDTVIDLKVLPDRAHYALSHRGIAGEVSLMIGEPIQIANDAVVESVTTKVAVDIKAPEFCPRYTARYIENVAVGTTSPDWLKHRLESIGSRSISNIVDATNYVMFDLGQPIHAFDADKVVGSIHVRKAKAGEKAMLLGDKEVTLTEEDHVIADNEGILAVAGVKGGKKAEVTSETKRLIVEVANFSGPAVRKTSARVGIRNDSSKRYENAITAEWAIAGMHAVSRLISEVAPGAAFGPITDEYSKPEKTVTFDVTSDFITERLGIEVPARTILSILASMNIGVTEKSGTFSLTIPSERIDLRIPADIVEEIGRIHGYDKVNGILHANRTNPIAVTPKFYLAELIKNTLVGLGFSEVYLYSLVAKGDIETAYPLARDKAFLRPNLTGNLAACVEKNARNADLLGLDSIKVFEIGSVFTEAGESLMLGLGAQQVKKTKGITGESIIKSALEAVSAAIGQPINPSITTKGAYSVCEINLGQILSGFKAPATYDALSFKAAAKISYKPFSPYPFMVRDIAVFVPENITKENVWETISKGITSAEADSLIARSALFDTFSKKLDDGTTKTSYAYRLVLQSSEKTLSDEEANAVMEKIYTEVKGKGWEVR